MRIDRRVVEYKAVREKRCQWSYDEEKMPMKRGRNITIPKGWCYLLPGVASQLPTVDQKRLPQPKQKQG